MTKVNRQYLIVGTFVACATIILLSIWLWFSSSNRNTYDTYLTVFNEPVDGLSVSSAIRYNGVEIGRVKKIKLDKEDPRNILVYLNIIPEIEVNKKTIAAIKSIGVTGISYIELDLPNDAKLHDNIKPHNKEPYPQITTKPSLLYNLSEQAQSVSNNIQDISGQMKLALSNENIKQISQILKNINKATEAIASNSQYISQTIKNLSATVHNIKDSTNNINHTLSNIDNLTQSLSKTSNNTNNLINNFNNYTLGNINQAIVQINQTSYQLEQLIMLINKNPSSIIRGVENKTPGPGEQP